MASSKTDGKAFVKCIDCKKAKALLQWYENPIIAICEIQDERQVAETLRNCKLFQHINAEGRKPIQHFNSYEESDAFFKS